MQIPVLIERVPGKGYLSRGVEPFNLKAQGSTREEALQRLQQLIAGQVAAGAEIVPLELPMTEHPWAAFAGNLKDEPMAEEWNQAMAEYRAKVQADPDSP
jgi:predicted RNase H-like HicB family nuclease